MRRIKNIDESYCIIGKNKTIGNELGLKEEYDYSAVTLSSLIAVM